MTLHTQIFPNADAAVFRAGVGRVDITPAGPTWMAGYVSRNRPSEGVHQRLNAKALAIEDEGGGRVVLVTTDLIGLPRALTDWSSREIRKLYKLDRARVVFNSSHTHTGPVILENLGPMYNLKGADAKAADAYRQMLAEKLVEVVGAALDDLQPAKVEFGSGTVGFAANRREMRDGTVNNGVSPNGPVDHSVPVVRVTAPDGKVQALLFGYACHNTTLTGEFYQLSGDYAGAAQAEVERALPGATALFFELCAGDQNPNPRSKLELAAEHGKALAAEVLALSPAKMAQVSGPARAVYLLVDLPLAPHTREQFAIEANDPNVFKARRAKLMLDAYDRKTEPRMVSLPVQVVRFDKGFTLIALGGEVVVDYALWAKKTWPTEPLMVAGYSNDVPCYIPNVRILREGGYEADYSMVYYGQPGPFTREVQERLQDGIVKAMKSVGR